MSQELYYTSAPQGLELGTSGFTTVAATRGMSPRLKEKLQAHSTYRHLFPPLDPRNATIFSHMKLSAGGPICDVLSRVSDAPLDYTGRGNYFAHHVILEAHELPRAGPAWLLLQPSVLESRWQGEPRWVDAPRRVPSGDISPIPCLHWGQWTGDPGWAGALLQEFDRDPNRPAALLTPPGFDALPLLTEALALLPAERRWEVTFSTLYLGVQPGTLCTWRFFPKALADSERPGWLSGAFVLDLSSPRGRAPDGPYAEAARAGRALRRPAAAPVLASVPAGAADLARRDRDALRRSGPEPYPTPVGMARPPRPEQLAVNSQPAEAPPTPPAESNAPPEESHIPREKPVGRFSFLALAVGLVIGLVIAGGGAMAYWQLGGLKDELESLRKEKPKLEKGLEAEQAKLTTMTHDKSIVDEQAGSLAATVKKQEGEIETLKKDLAKATGSSTSQAGELASLQQQLQRIQKKVGELSEDVNLEKARANRFESLVKVIRENISHELLGKSIDKALKEPTEANAAAVKEYVKDWQRLIGSQELKAFDDSTTPPTLEQLRFRADQLFRDFEKLATGKELGPFSKKVEARDEAITAYAKFNDRYVKFLKDYQGTETEARITARKKSLDELRLRCLKYDLKK